MKLKRITAMLLTLALLLTFAPTAVFAASEQGTNPANYQVKLTGTEIPYSNGEKGVVFDIGISTNSKPITSFSMALRVDASVLAPSSKVGAALSSGGAFVQPIDGVTVGGDQFSKNNCSFVLMSNGYYGCLLNFNVAGDELSTPAGEPTAFAKVYFVFKEGKQYGDLSASTVTLAETSDLSNENEPDKIPSCVDLVMIDGSEDGSYCFGTIDPAKHDNLERAQFGFEYPRSTATSAVSITGQGVNKAEDGSISFDAPVMDQEYTNEKPLAVAEIVGLAEGETATIKTGSISGDPSVVDFSVVKDGDAYKIVSNKAVPNDFGGDNAKVTIEVTRADNTTYTVEVPVAIPEVKRPSWKLDPASGTLMAKDSGNWTVSEALTALMKDDEANGLHNAGWELLTEASKAEDGWTLKTGTDTLPVADTPYDIPVIKAGDTTHDETVALYQVSIAKVPTQTDADDAIGTLDTDYTSTTTSITFTKANNPAWEYALVAKSNNTADLTALTYQRGVAAVTEGENPTAGGVTFSDLTPGTEYNLVVRAAAVNGTSTPVRSTKDASTKYDLDVRTAYLKNDTAKTEILVAGADGVKRAAVVTDGPITAETVDTYTQVFELMNNNGSALYDFAVSFEGTNADAFTAELGMPASYVEADGLAAGEQFTVVVKPNIDLASGVKSANLVITAKDAAGGTEVVRKEIPITLTVYGARNGDATGTDDVVLKPANLQTSDTSVVKAVANTAIKLDVAWDGDNADSYEKAVVAAGKAGDPYVIEKGSDATAAGITKDVAGNAIDANATYLVLTQDITDLGLLSTVNAVFNKDDTNYLIKQEAPVKVYVKAGANDVLLDEDGNPITPKIQDEYTVVIPSDTDIPSIDLTGGIEGVTVNETQALAGATLNTSTGSLSFDKTTKTGGEAHFDVTVPASDKYVAATIPVKVYLLEKQTAQTLEDIDLVVGEITDNKIKLPKIDGAVYTVVDGDGIVTEAEIEADTDGNYYVTLPDPVTDAAQITVNVTIPAKKGEGGEYKAEAVSPQKIMIRNKAAFTGTLLYEYDDTNKPTGEVTLDAKVEGAGMTYKLKSGGSILKDYNDVNHFTLADPTVYGKAVITVTSTETDTYTAGSKDIEIYVRQKNSGGYPDPDDPDLKPTFGTNANILGSLDGSTGSYNKTFDAHIDAASTDDYDRWNTPMFGAEISGLTKGVKYEIRFILEEDADTMDWYKGEGASAANYDEDGWTSLPQIGGPDGAQVTFFTFLPTQGKLLSVEIRYKDDGTVGGTTVDDTEPVDNKSKIIHGLDANLNYQYRVKNASGWDTAFEGANEEGWIDLPMADAVDDTLEGNEGLKMYTVTRTYDIVDVETRYTSKPSGNLEPNPDDPTKDDFVITGLIPNANYDLAALSEVEFKEDPKNYIVLRADSEGKIVITNGSENFTALELDKESSVLIRQSKTDTTLPGEPTKASVGVTVSGVVNVFAPNREGQVMLYPYNADGSEPKYYDLHATVYDTEYKCTFGGPSEPKSSGAAPVNFKIEKVPAGTYLLVVVKPGSLHFVVKNLVVDSEDIDLKSTTYPETVRSMNVIPGDLNGNGLVETNDSATLFRTTNWGKNSSAAAVEACDLNGNGLVETNDSAILFRSTHWGKSDTKITLS